jgi:tetratricopeptide (TPR) repeat protein
MERRASQESLVELIDSGQFLVAEEIFSERRTDDPMEMVIRSEVAMYFDRLDDAAALLEEVAPRVADITVAARLSRAKGRLALWRGDYQQAASQLQTAYHFYVFLNDSFGTSKSLLNLARLALQRGQLDDAAEKLAAAQSGVTGRTSKRTEYLRGLLASEQASLSTDRGEIEQATGFYSEAMRLLKATERGRFYGRALVGMADLKCAAGDFQESLEIYKEANTVFERYDLKNEVARSQLKLAQALIRLKRFERAEKLAEESRDLRRGTPAGESAALSVLVITALQQNELVEAASRATSAVDLADQCGSSAECLLARVRARIALGQVRLAEREFKQAAEVLKDAAELARSSNNSSASQRLELESIIYLAEAFHSVDTRAGRVELSRGSELLNHLEDTWLGEEFNRVSGKYEEQIVFTEDNRLVFDGNQLPRWQEAKKTLEGFLLRNALRQTNNSLTRAARKLGVSKVHVHNLKKKHGL